MDKYKPNSHRYKEEQQAKVERKPMQKVVSGKARVKKKGEVRKFMDSFFSEDIHNVKTYILTEVIIPSIKDALSNAINYGSDMMIYGDAKHSKKRSNASRVSYSRYYDDRRELRSDTSSSSRVRYSYDNVTVDSRDEAKEVLRRMDEALEEYGMVSVADFYDLVGVTGDYTDHNYGWLDLRGAGIRRTRDGYLFELPRVVPLR